MSVVIREGGKKKRKKGKGKARVGNRRE